MPDSQPPPTDISTALNGSPTGQHLLLGEMVIPVIVNTSKTDGAITMEIEGGTKAVLKVYSRELAAYAKFVGLPDPAPATTDLKDAMVAFDIITDGDATGLDLDGGDILANNIVMKGTLSAETGNLSFAALDITGGFTVAGNTTMTLDLTVRNISLTGTLFGAYGHSVTTQPTVTGSRGGNAALASLLTALDGIGWIVNSSSA